MSIVTFQPATRIGLIDLVAGRLPRLIGISLQNRETMDLSLKTDQE